MKNLIITVTGSDRPGIVSEISGIVTNYGGNVEESRMSKMGADFAIIMLISVMPEWDEALNIALNAVADLNISIKYTKFSENSSVKKYKINLNGADNEGIVKILSEYLAEKSINIIEMNTHITSAPVTGTPLFNLDTTITFPKEIIFKEVSTDLSNISQKLGVEIILHR